MITLTIDGKPVKTKSSKNLLWVALDNGFYIPNLCAIRGVKPTLASCRLCFVEIKGKMEPVTSCTETARDGMVVSLNTSKVKKLRSTAFELLLSHHHLNCNNCPKNKNCALQNIASKLHLKLSFKRFKRIQREMPIDSSHPLFNYDPNKCVLCGKCVYVCQQQGTGILDFAFRGIHTIVTTLAGLPLAESECDSCLNCVAVCPVGALTSKPGVSLVEAEAVTRLV